MAQKVWIVEIKVDRKWRPMANQVYQGSVSLTSETAEALCKRMQGAFPGEKYRVREYKRS